MASPGTSPVISGDSGPEFPSFVKQSVGLVGAVVAAVPILAQFFGTVKIPAIEGQEQARLMPLMATVLAGTLFLFLFWVRDKLADLKAGITGLLAVIVGVVLLVWTNSPSPPRFAAATYLVGFATFLGGGSLLFIFGFVRRKERIDGLADFAMKMEPDEWDHLKAFASTLITVRQSIAQRPIHAQSKKALESSAENLVAEYNEMLAKLRLGTLEIRGPAMDRIYGYFIEGVHEKFRALSRDDLDYWASDRSANYLEINQALIKRGCEVARVFLVRKSRSLPAEHIEAIRHQIRMGIRVRIAYLEDCRRIVADELDLDFGVFDSFAVSFWRRTADRIFRIATSPEECKRYVQIYEKVVNVCVSVPNKTGPVRAIFETAKDLDEWSSHLQQSRVVEMAASATRD